MSDEKYDFDVGEEGLSYDILDYSFNPSTKDFILKNGLKKGDRVLDVGCGSGIMTQWFAKVVGPEGHVVSIDNSQEQLEHAKRNISRIGLSNVTFHHLSAYDLDNLN